MPMWVAPPGWFDVDGWVGAGDEEEAVVVRDVVGLAEGEEVGGVVGAAEGARDDVVDVEVGVAGAAGDGAALVVASADLAADGRRDVLVGALRGR